MSFVEDFKKMLEGEHETDSGEQVNAEACGVTLEDLKKQKGINGDQTITYYVTVSIYRTRQNSPTSQYVLFNKLSNIESPPRRCTTAR